MGSGRKIVSQRNDQRGTNPGEYAKPGFWAVYGKGYRSKRKDKWDRSVCENELMFKC